MLIIFSALGWITAYLGAKEFGYPTDSIRDNFIIAAVGTVGLPVGFLNAAGAVRVLYHDGPRLFKVATKEVSKTSLYKNAREKIRKAKSIIRSNKNTGPK
jgi:hypothetical protein